MKITKATKKDISSMVALSAAKRADYEKTQPTFWKAHPSADINQIQWFESLLAKKDYLIAVAHKEEVVQGFIIGHIIDAPEVYEPGGKTLYIDDFCVLKKWQMAGKALLDYIIDASKGYDCCQALIVCGSHDVTKKLFIEEQGYSCISQWFHKTI